VLVVANLAATVLRFVLLRQWVFRPRATSTPQGAATSHAAAATDQPGARAARLTKGSFR